MNSIIEKTRYLNSLTILVLGLASASCGDDKDKVSPEMKSAQKEMGVTNGEFLKGNDPSFLEFNSLAEGDYELTAVKGTIGYSDPKALFTVGFQIDNAANRLVNDECKPDSQAIEAATQGALHSIYLNFASPRKLTAKAGSVNGERNTIFSVSAEMNASNDGCDLSVYSSTDDGSAMNVLSVFTSANSKRDGNVYSRSYQNSVIRAAFKNGANGGLELVYQVDGDDLEMVGMLTFVKSASTQAPSLQSPSSAISPE